MLYTQITNDIAHMESVVRVFVMIGATIAVLLILGQINKGEGK